jgi:hypothetical protein
MTGSCRRLRLRSLYGYEPHPLALEGLSKRENLSNPIKFDVTTRIYASALSIVHEKEWWAGQKSGHPFTEDG